MLFCFSLKKERIKKHLAPNIKAIDQTFTNGDGLVS